MKTFGQARRMAAVFLILSMIFALALIIPWYRIYKLEHANIVANKAYIFTAFIKHPKTALIFVGLTITWVVLSVVTLVKYSRTTSYFGGYFGAIIGRFIIIGEVLGFVSLMLVMLFAL